MEFLTGASVIAVWLLGDQSSPLPHTQRLFIQCMAFVVTPFTYIFNREVTKQVITMDNWFVGIKSVFFLQEKNDTNT